MPLPGWRAHAHTHTEPNNQNLVKNCQCQRFNLFLLGAKILYPSLMVHVCVSEGGLKDTECEEGSLFREGGRTPVFRALGVHTRVHLCLFLWPSCTELSNHNRNTKAWQRYHRDNYLISEHVIIIPTRCVMKLTMFTLYSPTLRCKPTIPIPPRGGFSES